MLKALLRAGIGIATRSGTGEPICLAVIDLGSYNLVDDGY